MKILQRLNLTVIGGLAWSGLGVMPVMAETEPQASWLLLYPQHPLHRRAVEKAGSATEIRQPPKLELPEGAGDLPEQKNAATPAPLFIEPLEPPSPEMMRRGPRYFPSFNAGSPSGFGANWGDVFGGISFVNRSSPIGSPTDKADGSISLGAGLGNANDFLGLEVVYNLISLTPSRFASNGSFDFKVHRALPGLMSVAVGWENAANYGPEAGGTPSTVYGSVSKFFVLQPDDPNNPMLLGLTLGAGGGRFRSFSDQINGVGSLGVFGSAGLQVLPNLSVITDWTGQNLNLGVSYVPFASVPLYVNGALVDPLGSTSFGLRYSLSVGFGFNFR